MFKCKYAMHIRKNQVNSTIYTIQLAFAEYVIHIVAVNPKTKGIMEMNREDKETYKYIVELMRLFRDLQKIERSLIILLKERRLELETGFDTLLDREEASRVIGLSTRQFDRIVAAGRLQRYETIYGLRFRLGDLIVYCQMRGETHSQLILKQFNPWSKRMTDLDKLLGQIMKIDLSHAPMDLC